MATEPLRALLSVWHKEAVVPLARRIHALGGELWASAGTANFLQTQANLPVRSVEELTGFGELLGGRVKTLHPAIFAGLLARPEDPLPAHIPRWNLVAVELYPFDRSAENWVELIDIGGVSLLRAAAKNFAAVWAVPGPDSYEPALAELDRHGGLPPEPVRFAYAAKAFQHCARYDSQIAGGFYAQPEGQLVAPLRYGENPHQSAFFLGALPQAIGGKPLSYNNLLDLEVGLRIVSGWPKPACAILKHTQPCGAAYADSPEEAYRRALAADPVAAYGGIVVCNFPITRAWAEQTKGHFIEVLAAPSFTPEALEWLQAHKQAVLVPLSLAPAAWEVRSAIGGILWQQPHLADEPTDDLDLRWAARLLRALYSNAIVLVTEGQLVAAASGCTSRIEAVRSALERAKQTPWPAEKLLLASDGFFPFTDSLELIHAAGVQRVAVPPGGKRQSEIEAFAQKRDICLAFLAYRHFRH